MENKTIFSIEGNLVFAEGVRRGNVEVNRETGVIERVGEAAGKADLVLGDDLVFPGFGDVHVHAREDASGKHARKEDFESMGRAALRGGVCFVADMPNNPIPPVDDSTYAEKEKRTEKAQAAVLLYAGIAPGAKPLERDAPYKVFMAPSVGDLFFPTFVELEKTIRRYRGRAVSFHCENPQMISKEHRPRQGEVSAIEFALELIEKYALQGKICHCSTKEGIEKIKEAKGRGVAVTCEVAPHHLYFDQEQIQDCSAPRPTEGWYRVNPPIRSKEDRLALIEALREGAIDYLASDHAPHTKEEKRKGAAGMPHLDTYGPFAAWLMGEHDFTPQDIARVCAYNPGRFMNQFLREKYGEIKEGYTGSFTILDTSAPAIIRERELRTKCGWSPFSGVEFPGTVLYTIHKGRILWSMNREA